MNVYFVRYPVDPNADLSFPVIDGCGFRFLANAIADAKAHPGSKIKKNRAESFGLTANSFKNEPHPPATPASGGKLARQILRNISGARYDRRKRPRGPMMGTAGLGMRPPGCGSVDYQDPTGKRAPRVYSGEPTDAAPECKTCDGDMFIGDDSEGHATPCPECVSAGRMKADA